MDNLQKIKKLSTAELADGMKKMNYINLKPIIGDKFSGIAKVVKLKKGYSSLVTEAINILEEGDILVIDASNTETAVWGDKKSTLANSKKIGGVIINGNIRDYEGCKEIGLPIACKDVVAFGSSKDNFGKIGGKISINDVEIKDGDFISCDSGGIVVIPFQEIEEVLQISFEKKLKDEEYKESFK